MAIYDPKSRVAEEFINDQEIRDTLAYAEEHKSDVPLLMSILDKAAQFKGLTHREAAVLLACDVKEVNDRIFETAIKVKEHIYGSRIVLFAPLYLSNYCVNTCTYCPYHAKNKSIVRKKLTQEEIRNEVIALQDLGHKRLLLEAGEHPKHNPIEYILESIKTIYSIKHKNGAIRRLNVNIAATEVNRVPRNAETRRSGGIFFPFHPARKQTPARIVNLRGIFGECVSFCAEMCYNESLRSIRRQ